MACSRIKGVPTTVVCARKHEQHTCIGVLEITSKCNLNCPMCYAASGPEGRHLTAAQCRAAIDRLVEVEGRPEVLQLSGGEPTIHPEFVELLDYACQQPIDVVMINTNGLRLATDPALVDEISRRRNRVEIYFQFDGFPIPLTSSCAVNHSYNSSCEHSTHCNVLTLT